ncbi:MAG: hypothetical protein CSA33_06395 [Desulfobulbus propionicus]|nr:MAG: hypothetical protein CSA33_06395 [Desulfobulbus propionicus]
MEQLVVHIHKEDVEKFVSLLQSGVVVDTSTENSILETVKKIEGFTDDYIEKDVQTIFLDGTAIDDIFSLINKNAKVLALSAAMPGLSGSIYRRNSIHSSLRSVHQDFFEKSGENIPVSITVKLFNSIARDRGPEILNKGFRMQTNSLMSFFKSREWLSEYIKSILLNNKEIQLGSLADLGTNRLINVQVMSF